MRVWLDESRCRSPAWSGRAGTAGSRDRLEEQPAEACVASADCAAERRWGRHEAVAPVGHVVLGLLRSTKPVRLRAVATRSWGDPGPHPPVAIARRHRRDQVHPASTWRRRGLEGRRDETGAGSGTCGTRRARPSQINEAGPSSCCGHEKLGRSRGPHPPVAIAVGHRRDQVHPASTCG